MKQVASPSTSVCHPGLWMPKEEGRETGWVCSRSPAPSIPGAQISLQACSGVHAGDSLALSAPQPGISRSGDSLASIAHNPEWSLSVSEETWQAQQQSLCMLGKRHQGPRSPARCESHSLLPCPHHTSLWGKCRPDRVKLLTSRPRRRGRTHLS